MFLLDFRFNDLSSLAIIVFIRKPFLALGVAHQIKTALFAAQLPLVATAFFNL